MEPGIIRDLVVIFALSVAVVLVFHRFKLPTLAGFLLAGALSGPFGFHLTSDIVKVEALAELGVVLLLFTVGIEFSFRELLKMRTLLFVGGGLQVMFTMLAVFGFAKALGASTSVALFWGMLISLSSTAIVLRILTDRGESHSPQGRIGLGILIFQDLCIIPMMFFVPFLTSQSFHPALLWMTIGKALLFGLGCWIAARYAVPWILRQVVHTRKREIFLMTIVLLCLGSAWISARIGLSVALGAFLAGLILSESDYTYQALSELLPSREILGSLFFISMGMLFDVRTVLEYPILVPAAIIGTIVLKILVTSGVILFLGYPLRIAVLSGLALSQIGEFSFVLGAAGRHLGILTPSSYQLFLATAIGTIALTNPSISMAASITRLVERKFPWLRKFERNIPFEPVSNAEPLRDHVIIVGYGTNGRNLARVLTHVRIPFVVIEMNPGTVRNERKKNIPMIYGDSTSADILRRANIQTARLLVLAISDAAATRASVDTAKRLNSGVHIIVRSRYIREMKALYRLGAHEVVPEEFETSIEIFSRVLHKFLVPHDVIEGCIQDIRKDGYQMFRSFHHASWAQGDVQRFLSQLSMEVFRVPAECSLAGTTLSENGLRNKTGATIVAIQRVDGETLVNPAPEDRIGAGDSILILGRPEQLSAAAALFTR